jgi:hypothetical protein
MSAVEDRPAIYPRPGSNKSFFAYPSTAGDVTALDSDQYFRLVPVRRFDKGPIFGFALVPAMAQDNPMSLLPLNMALWRPAVFKPISGASLLERSLTYISSFCCSFAPASIFRWGNQSMTSLSLA